VLEPLARKSDWVSLTAILCGVAPVPLLLLSVLPLVGCLSGPLILLAPLGAIGFGVAGLVRAKSQPEPNYVQPLTGLVLGFCWVVLALVGVVLFFRAGGLKLLQFD
jgi:hypothetical protein